MSTQVDRVSSRTSLRDYFDRVAARYSRAVGNVAAGQKVVALADVQSTDTALDVGAGSGIVLRSLHSRVAFAVSVDISIEMLRQLRNSMPHADCVLADALSLPFRDSCFDKVVSNEFWICMLTQEHQIASLKEMARVLRTGGQMVVGGIHNATPLRLLMPALILRPLSRVIDSGGRLSLQDAIKETRHLVCCRGSFSQVSQFGPEVLTQYAFSSTELSQRFRDAGLSIRRVVGNARSSKVPVISRFASAAISCSLLDLLAEKRDPLNYR